MNTAAARRLSSLRAALLPLSGRGCGSFFPVMIRPALGFSMVPRPAERASDGEALKVDASGPGPGRAEARRRIQRLLDLRGSAQPGPGGLVEGSKSDACGGGRRRRQGFGGLSAAGGKAIEDLCSMARGWVGCWGFWTVTIPPEAAQLLEGIEDGFHLFADRLRRRFSEELRRSCKREEASTGASCQCLWAFVVEPQESGIPHLHFVFRSKLHRGRRWLLGKARLDRLIGQAMRATTGQEMRTNASGNVQSVKRSVGAYLGGYLKKGKQRSGAEVVFAQGWSANLVPLRWWGWSSEAREWVKCHRFELPAVLVAFLSRQWPGLNGIGLIKASVWQPPGEGAPAIVCGSWLGYDQLERTIRHLVTLWENEVGSAVNYGIT